MQRAGFIGFMMRSRIHTSAALRVDGIAKSILVLRDIDFMFQLTAEEETALRSHFATSKKTAVNRGGRRYLPYAFTEQGVAILSSVLSTERAVAVNIEIMR